MTIDYCDITDLKEAISDPTLDSTYDSLFVSLISAASRLVDGFLKRHPGAFGVTADTIRYYKGSGERYLLIDEMAADPTTVYVAETGTAVYTLWATSDYWTLPTNAADLSIPINRLEISHLGTKTYWPTWERSVKVTGKFGFSAVPPDEIKEACIIQSVRWFKRGQQAFRDTGAIPEVGQLMYTQKLDPDVQQLISIPRFQRVTL